MATADGMEGASAKQPLNVQGNTSTSQDWAGQVVSNTLKLLKDPMLWAGAVAGFVAGGCVGFAMAKLGIKFG